MADEIVQLTERNPNKIWKTKETKIQMADMSDTHLQAALVCTQKHKMEAFKSFILNSKIEDDLKEEAKKRGWELSDVDELKKTYIGCMYYSLKDNMKAAFESIKRKAKKVK